MSKIKKTEKTSETQENTEKEFSQEDKQIPIKIQPQNIKSKFNTKFIPTYSFFQRITWGSIMLFSFVFIVYSGPFYCFLLVSFLGVLGFRQLNNLKRNYEKENKIPSVNLLNWYFFFLVNFFLMNKFFISRFPGLMYHSVIIFQYYNFISLVMFQIGILWFVLSLKKGYYRYQFRLFGSMVISIFFFILPIQCVYYNIYQGLCWFILSSFLTICNDIFAYLVGYFFGKHKLIQLSPKKTWEGYIGGAFFTVIIAIVMTYFLENYDYLMCPEKEFTYQPFRIIQCQNYNLTYKHQINVLGFPFFVSYFQIHSIILALFVCIIGPFGGFFASGFKRSIKIKDFGDLIPGHGGIIDRFDCHIFANIFLCFYLMQYGAQNLQRHSYLINSLSDDQQLSLFRSLSAILLQKNLLNSAKANYEGCFS